MKLKISRIVYKWLNSIGIIQYPIKQQQGWILVSFEEQIYFENGYLIGRVLQQLEKQFKLTLKDLNKIRKITVLKEKENWNIIWKAIQQLSIPYDQSYQELRISDNNDIIQNILSQIYHKYYEPNETDTSQFISRKIDFTMNIFTEYRNMEDSINTMDFICLALAKILKLKINDLIGMLINKGEYLALFIVQGEIKNGFNNVKLFYQMIINNYDIFQSMFNHEKQFHQFILSPLRAGLFSGSSEIAQLCIFLLKKLRPKEWFNSNVDGYKSVLLGIKRHPDLIQKYLDMLVLVLGEDFMGFLKNQLTERFNNTLERLNFCLELGRYLKGSLYRKEFISTQIPEDWLDACIEILDENTSESNLRIKALILISEILMIEDYSTRSKYQDSISDCYDPDNFQLATICQKLNYLNNLFRLLVHFAEKRSPTARHYYSLICTSLVVMKNWDEIRQFIVDNLRFIFERFDKIPLDTFLNQFGNKQINYQQPFDYNIFFQLSSNITLKRQNYQLLGYVSLKIFLQNLVNYDFSNIVINIVSNFKSQNQDFVVDVVKTLITKYNSLINQPLKKLKRGATNGNNANIQNIVKGRSNPKKMNYTKAQQAQLISQKQKSNILEFLRRIIINCNTASNLTAIKPLFNTNRNTIKKGKKQADVLDRFVELIEKMLKMAQNQQFLNFPNQTLKLLHNNQLTEEETEYNNDDNNNTEEAKPTKNMKQKIPQEELELQKINSRKSLKSHLQQSTLPQNPNLKSYTHGQRSDKQQLQIITSDELENHEIIYIKHFKQKHQKLLNLLFQMFNKFAYHNFVIYYELNKYINLNLLETIQSMVLKNQDKDSTIMNRHDFQDFIVQAALLKSSSRLNTTQNLDDFVIHIKQVLVKHGEDITPYQDLEQYYLASSEKVRIYTEKLQNDKDFQVPNDYKVSLVKQVFYNHSVMKKIRFPENWIICLEIISELLNNEINTQVIEPLITIQNKLCVRPKVAQKFKKDLKLINNVPLQKSYLNTIKQQKKKLPNNFRRESKEEIEKKSTKSTPDEQIKIRNKLAQRRRIMEQDQKKLLAGTISPNTIIQEKPSSEQIDKLL